MNKMLMSAEMEKEFEWRAWSQKIPFIPFPKGWEVQIIPPFCAAIVRFRVNTPKRKGISVYLDGYEQLGHFGEPHWEVYPDVEGNNSRFAMNDIDGLLKCIAGKK